MTFWAYMLKCADDHFYVGHTDALDTRMTQHEAGRGCAYTAKRLPVALVWSETFPSRLEALEAERRIKGWSRAKKEALIVGDWPRISRLAVAHRAGPSTSLRTNGGGEAIRTPPIAPEPKAPVRPEPRNPASHEPHNPVRPEPVEGPAPHEPRTP